MTGAFPPQTTSNLAPSPVRWRIAGGAVSLAEPVVMGILNLTPDSFSDGGELPTVEAVLRRAEQMVRDGAGVLDVGGESTRPGAPLIDAAEELHRVLPAIEVLSERIGVPISIDTRKARVAEAALAAGAQVVNDVSALSFEPDLADVVARSGAGIVLMHMRGTPQDMKERVHYDDLIEDVASELELAVERALERGIAREQIVIDPGIGFAKTWRQSLALIAKLPRLVRLGFPVLVGPSRKSFLGEVLGVPPKERVVGTATACVLAYQAGARLFRVHDVAPVAQALAVAHAVATESTS